MEATGVVKQSAGGLHGVAAEGVGWLEEALSSVLLSGGVRGGVGKPARDEEVVVVDEGSLTALLRDGFLS